MLDILIPMALAGIIGGRSEALVLLPVDFIRNLWDRLKKDGAPANHDLQRAIRKAYLLATRFACEKWLEKYRKGWGPWKTFTKVPEEHVQWADVTLRNIDQQLALLDSPNYLPPSSEASRRPQILIATDSSAAQPTISDLKNSLTDELVKEFSLPNCKVPVDFIASLEQEDDQSVTDAISGSVAWFRLLCAHFAHEVKNNQKLANILIGQTLADLSVGGITMTSSQIEARFSDWDSSLLQLLQRFDQLAKTVAAGHVEILEGFAENKKSVELLTKAVEAIAIHKEDKEREREKQEQKMKDLEKQIKDRESRLEERESRLEENEARLQEDRARLEEEKEIEKRIAAQSKEVSDTSKLIGDVLTRTKKNRHLALKDVARLRDEAVRMERIDPVVSKTLNGAYKLAIWYRNVKCNLKISESDDDWTARIQSETDKRREYALPEARPVSIYSRP